MALPQLIEQAAACQHKLLMRQCQVPRPQQHGLGDMGFTATLGGATTTARHFPAWDQ